MAETKTPRETGAFFYWELLQPLHLRQVLGRRDLGNRLWRSHARRDGRRSRWRLRRLRLRRRRLLLWLLALGFRLRRERACLRHRHGAAGDMWDRSRRPRLTLDGRARRQWPALTVDHGRLLAKIVPDRVTRPKADDPPVPGIDDQPAAFTAAIDHLDGVDEAALPRDAERREAVFAHHGVDFLRRQQPRAGTVRRSRPRRRIGTAKV